jgi:hypothetical protein
VGLRESPAASNNWGIGGGSTSPTDEGAGECFDIDVAVEVPEAPPVYWFSVKWNFGLSELAISERPSPGNSQSRLAAAPRYVFSGRGTPKGG